jgi:hypothetical protein
MAIGQNSCQIDSGYYQHKLSLSRYNRQDECHSARVPESVIFFRGCRSLLSKVKKCRNLADNKPTFGLRSPTFGLR